MDPTGFAFIGMGECETGELQHFCDIELSVDNTTVFEARLLVKQ